MAVATPECDKMLRLKEERHAEDAEDFLEWLRGEKGYVFARWEEDGDFLEPARYQSTESLLAEWLGIDLEAVERERRALLAEVRKEAK